MHQPPVVTASESADLQARGWAAKRIGQRLVLDVIANWGSIPEETRQEFREDLADVQL